jgi:hypothetical protein
MVGRRGFAALAFLGLARAARAQPIDVGPPLAAVTLRIGDLQNTEFLQDLAEYADRYGFDLTGEPGGPTVDGRGVFLAWFRRDDGVMMLVTDMAAPEKMQAFFYGRRDGTGGEQANDLVKAYVAKMGSYKPFN